MLCRIGRAPGSLGLLAPFALVHRSQGGHESIHIQFLSLTPTLRFSFSLNVSLLSF